MEDKKMVELNDDALEAVSGGLQAPIVGRRKITTCDDFSCVYCGLKKDVLGKDSHGCKPQGHGAPLGGGEYLSAIFENTCENCTHLYTCTRAYTYEGFGSPSPQ